MYETYPQLVSDETNACIRGLSNLIINMRSVDQAEIMVQESMHAINDLGSKRACQGPSMEDLASYSILKINVTHLPTALISGLCLPKECTPENL